MNTYLLIWNPSKWDWYYLSEAIVKVNTEGFFIDYWSCGRTKKIKRGDRFYLMKLGYKIKNKGLIASGIILSEPYELLHWNEEQAKQGKTALRVDILFEVISDIPIIKDDELLKKFQEFNWFSQSSGIHIPDDIAESIDNVWIERTKKEPILLNDRNFKTFIEGNPRKITIKTYKRSSDAKRVCLEYYGYDCFICGFNFEKTFGKLGKGFIHVHHLRPLSEIDGEYEINPIKDLRPVCANCHAMLHRKNPPYSIEELKNIFLHNKTV